MAALYLGNVGVLVVVAWAVWQRRATLRSRWDAPLTVGLALRGVGVALDSPWPAVAAASAAVTGKYYLLNTFGHISFLTAAAVRNTGVYLRLMPGVRVWALMRTRVLPLVAVAAVIMLVCVVASPATSSMTAEHLYMLQPDRWLAAYWTVFLAAGVLQAIVALYGLVCLRRDPDAVGLTAQTAASATSIAVYTLLGVAILTEWLELPVVLLWPLAYAMIAVAAIVAVRMWRRRIATFFIPPQP